mmetsp:Transcript_104293/g.290545  ORF Transcript_104293/g.290545 Transcript_104293/m.290545 type:complete len:219 (+) Transcript_104293:181-837(+)
MMPLTAKSAGTPAFSPACVAITPHNFGYLREAKKNGCLTKYRKGAEAPMPLTDPRNRQQPLAASPERMPPSLITRPVRAPPPGWTPLRAPRPPPASPTACADLAARRHPASRGQPRRQRRPAPRARRGRQQPRWRPPGGPRAGEGHQGRAARSSVPRSPTPPRPPRLPCCRCTCHFLWLGHTPCPTWSCCTSSPTRSKACPCSPPTPHTACASDCSHR